MAIKTILACVSSGDSGKNILKAMTELLKDDKQICVATTIIQKDGAKVQHCGVLFNKDGTLLRQPQIHKSQYLGFEVDLGDHIKTVDTPFGRVAMIIGEDTIYPELFRLAAINGAHMIISPFHQTEAWESQWGLPERAAENRLAITAVTRPTEVGSSFVLDLHEDLTLMTEWKNRQFDGTISAPLVSKAGRAPSLTVKEIHPGYANKKLLSHMTDVVRSRPTNALIEPIVS